MNRLLKIHRCLSDESRLRILHVLTRSPLCVCHFQEILRLPQVAVSKHLAYLRRNGMVEAERRGKWMIYRLPKKQTPELERQLQCLQDCATAYPVFQKDLVRLGRFGAEGDIKSADCKAVPLGRRAREARDGAPCGEQGSVDFVAKP